MGDRQGILHGTDLRYRKYGCRCGDCTEAHRVEQIEVKARRVKKGRRNPTLIPHGTAGGYTNWDCRCSECSDAMLADDRRKRSRAPFLNTYQAGHRA